ncbi:hypothetical protein ARTHRO9AX_80182 [Arthrobacter sp. 9AX]|nr:hypothetical protein ARTHRO9AX_80182 [Arthrobacter sp. 9AX]
MDCDARGIRRWKAAPFEYFESHGHAPQMNYQQECLRDLKKCYAAASPDATYWEHVSRSTTVPLYEGIWCIRKLRGGVVRPSDAHGCTGVPPGRGLRTTSRPVQSGRLSVIRKTQRLACPVPAP